MCYNIYQSCSHIVHISSKGSVPKQMKHVKPAVSLEVKSFRVWQKKHATDT